MPAELFFFCWDRSSACTPAYSVTVVSSRGLRPESRIIPRRRVFEPAGAQQADGGFTICNGAVQGPLAGLLERYPVNFDDFRALVGRLHRRKPGRQEKVKPFGEHPRGAPDVFEAV